MKYFSLFATLLLLLSAGCSKKQTKHKAPPLVRTAYPIVRTVPDYVDTTGHMDSIHRVKIEPQVDGQIVAIHYEEGDFIKEGSLVVTVDPRFYLGEKTRAEGELMAANAMLSFAKDTAIRNQPLALEDYVSQLQFDQLLYNVDQYEGTVKQSEGDLQKANVKVGYTTIYAPITGVLGERLVDRGDIVTAAEGIKLVTINQIAPIWSRFGVPEQYLLAIQKERRNHPIEVWIYDTDPDTPISKGELVFIDNNVNKKTGMITMKGHFDNDDYVLWPGQYLKVRVIVKMLEDAILIPVESVQTGSKGKYVFTIDDKNVVHKKEIETYLLQDNGSMIMVTKGLSSHDQIVTEGQINLYDGVKARKAKKDEHVSTEHKGVTKGR